MKSPTGYHARPNPPQSDPEPSETALESKSGRTNGFTVGLAKLWHWIVLGYLGVMFVVVMTQPAEVTLNALIATGQVIAALIVASLVSGWLSAAMVRGVASA